MPSSQLIAYSHFPDLSYSNHHFLIDTRVKLITFFSIQNLYINHRSPLTMRHPKTGIPYFSCFLSKNSSQQPFLCRQLRFSLGSNLTHQNIIWPDLTSNHHNPILSQIP